MPKSIHDTLIEEDLVGGDEFVKQLFRGRDRCLCIIGNINSNWMSVVLTVRTRAFVIFNSGGLVN